MNPQQKQHLIAIMSHVDGAITILSNYAQTTSDQQQLSMCFQTMTLLNAIRSAALQAFQAANNEIFLQETTTLKASTTQLKAQEAQINTILQAGGIAIQVISAVVQIAALVAAL